MVFASQVSVVPVLSTTSWCNHVRLLSPRSHPDER